MELDYASIINAGQGLVGDLQQQMFLNDQRKAQAQARQLQTAALQQKQQRDAAFKAAAAQAAQSSDPKALSDLMIQFPEFADQIKPGWQALSDEARRRNLTQSGTIFVRAKNGDAKGAAALLRQRYEADLAAGQADPSDKELIDALESGDPARVQQATATVGMMLAADDPSKFAETYGKLFPTDATTTVQKEYQWRVQQFGQQKADEWLAVQDTKLVPVEKGGQVFSAADLIGGGTQIAGGGDQSTGGRGIAPTGSAIEAAAKAAVPGLTVTSRQRSPGKNAAVGGVAGSYHLTDQARDFVPPKGMSMAGLHDELKKAFPGFDVLNEGDHVHIEPKEGTPRASGPVKVRSVQEARRLPSGTVFVTPDGRTMRKP